MPKIFSVFCMRVQKKHCTVVGSMFSILQAYAKSELGNG